VKIVVSWSSGKDSAWTLHTLLQQQPSAVAGLLCSVNDTFDRVAMHAVRREVLEAQARAARLPLYIARLPWPCSNEEYEQRMGAAVADLVAAEFTHVAFGDLFLEDVRAYREQRLAGTGLTPIFPLWKRPTAALAREMINGGLQAYLTCIDPQKLRRDFAGRAFDATLIEALPASVDPCGENGEFHTCVWTGPMFAEPVGLDLGETVERDGFVFNDLLLKSVSGGSEDPPLQKSAEIDDPACSTRHVSTPYRLPH